MTVAASGARSMSLRRALLLILCAVLVALLAQHCAVSTPDNHSRVVKSKQELEASGPGCTPTTCRQPTEAAALRQPAVVQQASPSGSTTISCPTYSGPLFRKDNAQFQSVSGAALPLYDHTQKPQAPAGWLQPFPLSDVKLVEGTAQWRSMSVNVEYLLQLQPDMLLWSWRRNAGLSQPAGARPAGGWEAPSQELRGHFLGHWLSATAMQWASSNDTRLERRMRYVVGAMAEVASGLGSSGYLSAFPDTFLDRYERIEPVWAPYYTLHKVMAGLLDMHVYGKSAQALELTIGLAGYIGGRVERLVERRGLAHHWRTLDAEFGGVNDVLWKLAGLTGRAEHRKWASLFDKPCFLAPLALPRAAGNAGAAGSPGPQATPGGADSLTRMHGNTHVPVALGALHRHEVTGEPIFRLLSEQFLTLINATRTYATGGSTHQEEWGEANRLGHLLGKPPFGTVHQESCVTHNTHRLATDLFRATREGRYADFMERLQLNGVMGTQRGSRPGQMLYFYPLGTGVSKTEVGIQAGMAGWSHPTNYFSCCMGTGVEAHAKLQSEVFFRQADALWVATFVSTRLDWADEGLIVALNVSSPADIPSATGTPAEVTLTIEPAKLASSSKRRIAPSLTRVHVRVPLWARLAHAELGGLRRAQTCTRDCTGGLHAEALLSTGDAIPMSASPTAEFWSFSVDGASLHASGATATIRMALPAMLRPEPLRDSRCAYRSLTALLYGPLVLAGLTADAELTGSVSALDATISPVPLEARSQLTTLSYGRDLVTHTTRDPTTDPRLYLQRLRSPGFSFPDVRRGGSAAANAATFRWIPLANGTVALESFALPKCFVGPSGRAGGLSLLEPRSYGASPPVFRAHAQPAGFLLESVAAPGTFIGRTAAASTTLVLGARENALAFKREPSAAQYPKASFWAKTSRGRAVLMWPLNEMIDETYTVYFRLCASSGCPVEKLPRNGSRWLETDGYLPEGLGGDLYSKTTTISQAKAICAADTSCSSFSANCASRACTAEPGHLQVFFKSYDTPLDRVGRQDGAGLPRWHTFYLPEDDGTKPCVVEYPKRRERACTRRPKADAPWQEAEGYLIAESRSDLYQKRATVEGAMAICAADDACTSFTAMCATATCDAERTKTPVDTFFKSYAEPLKHIGREAQAPSADRHWRSFYVRAADTEEVCADE